MLMVSLVWQMTEVLSCTLVTLNRSTERTDSRLPSTQYTVPQSETIQLGALTKVESKK